MWFVSPPRTKKIALGFAQLAVADRQSSVRLCKARLYPQSIYHFQQGVEKAAKAYGLLMGTLIPTSEDLRREVSHRSVLGMVLRLPAIIEAMPKQRQSLRQDLDRPELRKLGGMQLFEPILTTPPTESSEEVRRFIKQVKSIDPATLWRVTLELDLNHAFTKFVLNALSEADKKHQQADEAERFFRQPPLRKIRRFLSRPENLVCSVNLFRSGAELVPLTLVSMCHDRETRYPPVEEADYWDPAEYTQEKGLVKNLSIFHFHMKRLCNSILAATEAANRHKGL